MEKDQRKIILGIIGALCILFFILIILVAFPQTEENEINYYIQSNNVNSIVASNINFGAVQEKVFIPEKNSKEYPIIRGKEPVITTKTKQCSYVRVPYKVQEKILVSGEPCEFGRRYPAEQEIKFRTVTKYRYDWICTWEQ